MNQALRRTPLADEHVDLGGKMVDFGGWFMPVHYGSQVEEHQAVRERVGLFDVSHMGEVRVQGKDTLAYLSHLTVNDPYNLEDGQAQYTAMLYPEGTVVDDLLIYRIGAEECLLVINAANIEKDFTWMLHHIGEFDVVLENESDRTGQIAIQGPLAEKVLQKLAAPGLADLGYYRFRQETIEGMPVLVSRTGYTGEDGFECYLPADHTVKLWKMLLEAGRDEGIQPAGLGARDTLRLEARMHLYGQDMDQTTTVLEAGLGWITKFKKPADFIGKEALLAQKKAGLDRKLIGFEVTGRGIARHGYPVVDGDREIGHVTSGTHSPTLKKSIGLAYLPRGMAKSGTEFQIRIRNKVVPAVVVKGPFYQRS